MNRAPASVAVPPAEEAGTDDIQVFPASAAQQRFWILDQLDDHRGAYTIPLALRLTGALDVEALQEAFNTIVARHETLRTVFALEGDEAVQVIVPQLNVDIVRVDLADLPVEEREAAVLDAAAHAANQPFDLARGPLLRVALLRLAANEHVLLITLHHIVADGWSIGVLFRELQVAYDAFATGTSPALAPLAVQYPDYAVWQRRMMAGATAARQLAFWTSELGGNLPVLELPTDRPRPPVLSNVGAKRELALAADTVEQLRALGRAENATPYMTFLAAFMVLLQRYTNQDDLIVGSITAGRNRPELEPLIGLFLNTVAIRVNAPSDTTFRAMLRRVRDAAMAAMANQEVPFEEVLDAIGAGRDRSRSPVFQAAFQLLESLSTDLHLRGLDVAKVPLMKETAKFELTLMLSVAASGGLRAVMEYNAQLFDAGTIDRMLRQYQVLLRAITANPDQPVSSLNLIPPAELELVTSAWNATEAAVPVQARVEQLFAAQAARTPAAMAVLDGETALTYAELDTRATSLAARLRALGAGPDVLIGISLQRSVDVVVAVLAVMKAGGAYLPLDPDYPADRLAYIVRDSGVGIVISDATTEPVLPADGLHRVSVRDATTVISPSTEAPADGSRAAASSSDLAYVIYTSGSTGRPKGVEIEHRSVVNFLAGMQSLVPLGGGDRLVAVTPLSFDISALELFLPLVQGATVVIARREQAVDGLALAALLERSAATHLQATPSTWRLLVESGWSSRPGMVALCGGEALAPALAHALISRGVELWNLYGPTEATIWATAQHVVGSGDPVRIGRPMANVRAYVLDEKLHPVPIGVPGELWLAGHGLARGYRGRADLTAERFVADPFSQARAGRMYRTGDRARWHEDGTLEYLGRVDFQVKLRGHRIELGEIESVLVLQPDVAAAVAMVREDAGTDAQLVAYVTLRDRPAATTAALRAWLHERLPDIMVPAAIVVLDQLPLTPNGKVDRKALPAPAATARQQTEYMAPRTDLERLVAAAWGDVLRVERVGIHDDFFELGGHSLAAMRIIARLSTTLPAELTLGALLRARTVAAFAELVAALPATAAPSTIRPRDGTGPSPLSHPQQLIWLFEQMTPGTATYNIPMVRRIKGSLDFGAFDRALTAVVARHEVLRTRFEEIDGEVRQLVQPARPVRARVVDLRADPDPDAVAHDGLTQEASRPFDLRADVMLRALAVRLRDDDTLLLLVAHHIAFDGGSVGVLMHDLGAFYEHERNGMAPLPAPLPIQFADYATWERTPARETQLERSLGYWRGQLAGAPGTLDLPTDHPRTADPSGPGARYVTTFPPELTTALHALAREHDATLFMVLLAGFQALLHRYSGQDDLVVGAAIAGRVHGEAQDMVGYFANTLALRAQFDDSLTFAQHLANVRQTCLDAYEHQDVPYEKIALDLRPSRGSGDAGLFSVMFVLQDGESAPLRLGHADVTPAPVDYGLAKFDLSCSAAETAHGLRLGIEYRTDLFDAGTVSWFAEHLTTLLNSAATDDAQQIDDLALFHGDQLCRLTTLPHVEAEQTAPDVLVTDLIAAQVRRTPQAVAIATDDSRESLTYAELEEESSRLARELTRQHVGVGSIVALVCERSPRTIAWMLATMKAGGAYLPIDPTLPPDRIRFMLADANPALIVTHERLVANIEGLGVAHMTLESASAILDSVPPLKLPPGARPESLAYVLYTSGSTGAPKAVMVPHRALSHHTRWIRSLEPMGEGDTVFQKTPLTFDPSGLEIFLALTTGARLFLARPQGEQDLEYVLDTMRTQRVTMVIFIPSALAASVQLPGFATACAALRLIICGGEVLTAELARTLISHATRGRVFNLYGPTEATIAASAYEVIGSEPPGPLPIGSPVPGLGAWVVDARLRPVPLGAFGELCLSGPQTAIGYLNRPAASADRFVPNPFAGAGQSLMYRTGDRVRLRSDHLLEFGGRLDSQVKLRGFRIELGEIESALAMCPGVREVAVLLDESPGSKRLIAYYVTTDGHPTPQILASAMRRALPDYMIPARFVALDKIPVTPNGKLDRHALPAPAILVEDSNATPPRNGTEEVLRDVWAAVLGSDVADVHADFFELGGHSLLATQVTVRIARLFRTSLPLRCFFENATIAALARELVRTETKPGQIEAIAGALIRLREMTPAQRATLRNQ